MIVKLYINNEKLDLSSDESISIQSSVLSSQDITKNTTEFSKDFTVPASDINNEIFKHYYNANIDNTFDARTKVKGAIEIDGLPFKKGSFSLRKVVVKSGVASHYSIYFTGDGTDIKKSLGNAYITDLNLTAFNHAYNSDNVKAGLTNSLFSGDIIYNLLIKQQLFYNSTTSESNNIAFINTSQTNGVLWSELRPAIKVNRLIEAIEDDYNLQFSGDFFQRQEFDNLYLWLNPDKENKIGLVNQIVNFDGGNSTYMDFATNIGSYYTNNTEASGDREWWDLTLTITPASGFSTVPYTIKYYKDGNLAASYNVSGTRSVTNRLQIDGGFTTYDIYFEIETYQEFQFTKSLKQKVVGSFQFFTTTGTLQTIQSTIVIKNELPKIKIIDFLRGLFKMFKLVVVPTSENNFYINDLNTYYSEGNLIDVTEYIDFESVDVNRGKILNDIKYKFEDPTTILNNQFKISTGVAYGDEELLLEDGEGNPLEGESLSVEVPFEQIIYERLSDLADDVQTNIMYGAVVDESLSPANPKAHLFYNVNTDLDTKQIAFIEDTANVVAISTLNNVSHTINFEDKPFSTIFSSEFSEWDSTLIENTLYTNYHSNYISSLFNIKRRDFSFTANLPTNILTTIKLNDVLKIKEDYYRIDNYTLGLTDGKSKLNLINSFDNDLRGFAVSQTSIVLDYRAQSQIIRVTSRDPFDITEIDQGYGLAWSDATQENNDVTITVTENATGDDRFIVYQIQNEAKTKSVYVYVTQTF